MKRIKVWGLLFVLSLSMFSANPVFAADDDLPEPLNENSLTQHDGN